MTEHLANFQAYRSMTLGAKTTKKTIKMLIFLFLIINFRDFLLPLPHLYLSEFYQFALSEYIKPNNNGGN